MGIHTHMPYVRNTDLCITLNERSEWIRGLPFSAIEMMDKSAEKSSQKERKQKCIESRES